MIILSGRIAAACGAAAALLGTFLPWLSSGSVARSSFELHDVIERIGFSPDGLVGLAFAVWPLAPLVLVLVIVAQWPGWESAWALLGAAVFAGVVAMVMVTTAVAVIAAPDIGVFRVRAGVWVTLAGGGAMLVGAGLVLVGFRWGRPTGLARRGPA